MDKYLEYLINFLTQHPYTGVTIALLLTSFGLPCPEDIILVTAGYMVYLRLADLYIMILICILSIIFVGDFLIYLAGRFFGEKLFHTKLFTWFLTTKRLEKVQRLYLKYGGGVIFIARFMFGLRATIYFLAGYSRYPAYLFILMDFLAGLISIPVFVYLGYYFGYELEVAFSVARRFSHYLFFIIFLVVLFFIVYKITPLAKKK